jgi:hypothetical protein
VKAQKSNGSWRFYQCGVVGKAEGSGSTSLVFSIYQVVRWNFVVRQMSRPWYRSKPKAGWARLALKFAED